MALFSTAYSDARGKFTATAKSTGGTVAAITQGNGLEVDVASWGKPNKPTLLVSSGLHGVEGFFGSAVQLAAIEKLFSGLDPVVDLNELHTVFVHGINPFGFSHGRRVDENNVDLNRNFLKDRQHYRGAPDAYRKLNGFLNPQSPPDALEPYTLKAAAYILRYGVPALKEAIACGQYQYPKGIFYGGSNCSTATEFVMENCESWVDDAKLVVHIDLHTGLGKFGEYKILLNDSTSTEDYRWYERTFGENAIADLKSKDKTAYEVSGGMGAWLQNKFTDRRYYFAGAEFGTYSPVRVLGALRAENRTHHYASPDSDPYKKAKAELMECFCPASEHWRKKTIGASVKIISAAIRELQSQSSNQ